MYPVLIKTKQRTPIQKLASCGPSLHLYWLVKTKDDVFPIRRSQPLNSVHQYLKYCHHTL